MNKPKKFPILIVYNIILWSLTVCAISFVLYKKITPSYSQESLNAIYSVNTPDLYSKDVITQTFISTNNNLTLIEIALFYKEDISQDAQVRVQLLHEEEVIMEQDLTVAACPNQAFIPFHTLVTNCQGEEFMKIGRAHV